MRRSWAVSIAMLLVTVGGCASVAPRGGVTLPVDLRDLSRWEARGRLGVSSGEGGGSGSFVWQQREDRADVQIRGPVGIGSVRLQVRGATEHPEVRLETSDGRVLESDAAWRELELRLGSAVPAGHLRYWMLGLAAPGAHTWVAQSSDGPAALEQNGWHIDYQDFAAEAGARVPVRIRASSGAARVRIVVDRWQLGTPGS